MSGVDVAALRAAAEAVEPDGYGESWFHPKKLKRCLLAWPGRDPERYGKRHAKVDAEFIAAASPTVVLALLDRVSELEAVAERVREVRDQYNRSENWRTWGVPAAISWALDGPQDALGADLRASEPNGGQLPHPSDDEDLRAALDAQASSEAVEYYLTLLERSNPSAAVRKVIDEIRSENKEETR